MLRLGVHLSIARGLNHVIKDIEKFKINTFQSFIRNPRGYNMRRFDCNEIKTLREFITARGIFPYFIHAGYIVNLCSPSKKIRVNSIRIVTQDLKIASKLGANYYVIHFGSHPDKKTGLKLFYTALKEIVTHAEVEIILENTAGEGNKLGASLDDILWITTRIKKIGICLDTAHLFSAGYDIRDSEIVNEIFTCLDKTISRERLKLIHLNDSYYPLGANKDRHHHIGKGYIGEDGFRNFLAHPVVRSLPLILETPKKNEKDDIVNLNKVKYLITGREV